MLNAYDVRVELQLSDTRNHGVFLFNSFYCALEMQLIMLLWHLGGVSARFQNAFHQNLLFLVTYNLCEFSPVMLKCSRLGHIFKTVIYSKMY